MTVRDYMAGADCRTIVRFSKTAVDVAQHSLSTISADANYNYLGHALLTLELFQ